MFAANKLSFDEICSERTGSFNTNFTLSKLQEVRSVCTTAFTLLHRTRPKYEQFQSPYQRQHDKCLIIFSTVIVPTVSLDVGRDRHVAELNNYLDSNETCYCRHLCGVWIHTIVYASSRCPQLTKQKTIIFFWWPTHIMCRLSRVGFQFNIINLIIRCRCVILAPSHLHGITQLQEHIIASRHH